jgi:hypothetical protein
MAIGFCAAVTGVRVPAAKAAVAVVKSKKTVARNRMVSTSWTAEERGGCHGTVDMFSITYILANRTAWTSDAYRAYIECT